jgi:RimJ/RimL family protein N-acetyltransferase
MAPPSHARPFHQINTPRLIIRSGLPSDAKPFATIRQEPLNNPYGGVHEPDLDEEVQRSRLKEQKTSTANGHNAFMVIVLKPASEVLKLDQLTVDDGILIGMTGFNSYPTTPSLSNPGKSVLVGDIGALVDYRYARKGYGLEALESVIEYGFDELGCGEMSMDTFAANTPWRGLMNTMGLGDTGSLRSEEAEDRGPLKEEVLYRFGKSKWEEAKKAMMTNGKWLL